MREFIVVVSDQALEDADSIYDYICNQAFAPMTAALYYQGLLDKMHSLSHGADSLAVDLALSAHYGKPTRRINYKKYAIIYFVEGVFVFIERVMPQSMIVF